MDLIVSPAYGRDYKDGKEALAAWTGGKNFWVEGPPWHAGKYCSIRDIANQGIQSVEIRFHKKRNLVIWKA